jgi:hypothetical protein
MKTQMFDTDAQLIINDFTLGTENKTCLADPGAPKQAYQTGGFIEALAVLADVTGDLQWPSLWVIALIRDLLAWH